MYRNGKCHEPRNNPTFNSMSLRSMLWLSKRWDLKRISYIENDLQIQKAQLISTREKKKKSSYKHRVVILRYTKYKESILKADQEKSQIT